jgi:hypothetical protein
VGTITAEPQDGCRARTRVTLLAIAIAAIAFETRSALFHGRVDAPALPTSNMSPHEIHLNYEKMKELPANEVKEPF